MLRHGRVILASTAVSLVLGSAGSLQAQTDGTCIPISERAGREFGCFITAREELGALPAQPPLYWHLDTFPTASAARAAKGPRGTVVESLGRVWLFTIAEAEYRPVPVRALRGSARSARARGTLRCCLHGRRVSAGDVDADSSAPRRGSVVHVGRIHVRGNSRWTHRSARGRSRRPGPGRRANGTHRHRLGTATVGRVDPAGHHAPPLDAGSRLDASGPLSSAVTTERAALDARRE